MRHQNSGIAFCGHPQRALQLTICVSVNLNDVEFLMLAFGIAFWTAMALVWVAFLLKDCKANPNIGNRNPLDSGYLRQKNEGNMALMVAAYHGREALVRMLCEDPRTSINQQDSNGYTALMKACMNGNTRCRDILREFHADDKIVDINGMTADDHFDAYLGKGPTEKRYNRTNGNKKHFGNGGKRW